MRNLYDVNEFIENIPKNLIQKNNVNKKNITQLFAYFLYKNNVYVNFKFNHYFYNKCKSDWASYPFPIDEMDEMDETELISNARCFISSAFVWHETTEGGMFWSELNKNWLTIINKVLTKNIF